MDRLDVLPDERDRSAHDGPEDCFTSRTASRPDAGAVGLSIALLHNPAAGSYCARKLARLHEALERQGHHVRRFDSRGFAQVGERFDVVCVFGGDGTSRVVVEEGVKADLDALYCCFPAGTINLIAREAGYPRDVERFARMLGHRTAHRQHHFGTMGDKAILCCASIGPDSHVVARVDPGLKKRVGRFAYVVACLRMLVDWPRTALDVTVDGQHHAAEAAFLLKGRAYAGPWSLDDAADLRSDSFRVLLMPRARRLDALRLALFAAFGRRFADRRWLRLSGRSIAINAESPVPVQVDGDIVASTPVSVEIARDSLRFL